MNTSRSQNRAKAKIERKYTRPTYNALQQGISRAIRELGNATTQSEMESLTAFIEQEQVEKTLYKTYEDTFKTFTRGTYEAIAKDAQKAKKEVETGVALVAGAMTIPPVSDALLDDWARVAIRFAATQSGLKAKMMTETSRELFLRAIRLATAEALNEGLSVFQARKRIQSYTREYMGKQNRYRAVRVMRTEVGIAANEASLQAAKATGLQMKKKWVATQDERTRDTHAELDGTVVLLDDYFNVNGTPMDKPQMVGAPASEVINCRCTMVYITPNNPEYNQS